MVVHNFRHFHERTNRTLGEGVGWLCTLFENVKCRKTARLVKSLQYIVQVLKLYAVLFLSAKYLTGIVNDAPYFFSMLKINIFGVRF